MMSKLKRGLFTLAATVMPVLTFAQESSGNSIGPVTVSGQEWGATYQVGEVSSVTSMSSGLQSMFGGILGTLVPVVGAVVLAGVAVWAMPRIVGIIKSAFQTGKGR